ncbi:MAG: hypothetical protein IT440_10415 [Phycisphaeraceae bacterium]|nr:hypothetical protein [Phycisphaeraceae bacterium]
MSGAYRYTNRSGDVYFLQSKVGTNGKPRVGFARKLTGEPVYQLPQGYEVREHPESAQVVLRKCKPSPIRPEEKQLLDATIRKETHELMFIVDVEDRSLVIYTSEMDVDIRIEALRSIIPMDAATEQKMRADLIALARYQKMMRFTLTDPERRLFSLDRWCFLGSIDDWYFLEGNQPLVSLAEKYTRHLGEDSFFELM